MNNTSRVGRGRRWMSPRRPPLLLLSRCNGGYIRRRRFGHYIYIYIYPGNARLGYYHYREVSFPALLDGRISRAISFSKFSGAAVITANDESLREEVKRRRRRYIYGAEWKIRDKL